MATLLLLFVADGNDRQWWRLWKTGRTRKPPLYQTIPTITEPWLTLVMADFQPPCPPGLSLCGHKRAKYRSAVAHAV